MTAFQVEGDTTGRFVDCPLNALREDLKSKKLLYIEDICREYDDVMTLESLIGLRKKDILELIDEINDDKSIKHHISVSKKNKFAQIINKYRERNLIDDENEVKQIIVDKEERDAAIAVSKKIEDIKLSIINTAKTDENVDLSARKCEKEIEDIFNDEIERLKKRKQILLHDLYALAYEKKKKLQKQQSDLKDKLKKTKVIYSKINKMMRQCIDLHEMERRKQLILKESNNALNDTFEANRAIHINIQVSANVKSIQNIIRGFGKIICINDPVLLNVFNDGNNGNVLVQWNVNNENENKEKMMNINIEWRLSVDDENENEEKKEFEEWNKESVSILAHHKINEYTMSLKQTGTYQFKVSYYMERVRLESDMKSIKIKKILSILIVKENERKLLESDKLHVFDEVIIKSNGILSTTKWNGTNGGMLLLETQTLIIQQNGSINLDGIGYRGGTKSRNEMSGIAFSGGSVQSPIKSTTNSSGGGGGGTASGYEGTSGGGGGGYGTKGTDAQTNSEGVSGGKGGSVYGDSKLTNLYLGSGGGSGHSWNSDNGQCGGTGGGALRIRAQKIMIKKKASISCNGQNAPSVNYAFHVSGGGGGSGGSIHIMAQSIINHGDIFAKGGKAAQQGDIGWCSSGGAGGCGRIRIDTDNLKDIGNVKPRIGYTQKY